MGDKQERGSQSPLPDDVVDMALLSSGIDERQFAYAEGRHAPKTPSKKNSVRHVSNVETPFKLRIKKIEESRLPDRRDDEDDVQGEDRENQDANRPARRSPREGRWGCKEPAPPASGDMDGCSEVRGRGRGEDVFASPNVSQADEDTEVMWFKKKRAGRKMKKDKICKRLPESVIRGEGGQLCKKEHFFPTHFKTYGAVHSSTESIVFLCGRKGPCEDCQTAQGRKELQGERAEEGWGSTSSMYIRDDDVVDIDTYTFKEVQVAEDVQGPAAESLSMVKVCRRKFGSVRERKERLQEAKFLKKLSRSRNIVHMRRSWEEKGILFIEMEPCNMGTLKHFMRDRRNQEDEMAAVRHGIILQATKGLAWIHRLDIIHMDIKPENIFLHRGAVGKLEVKIGDFGISRSARNREEIEFDGDRFYMAPEILSNRCSFSSDIYSLGLVFTEVLFGIPYPVKSREWIRTEAGEKRAIVQSGALTKDGYKFLKSMTAQDDSARPPAREVLAFAQKLGNQKASGTG